jgi:hypothetical protein
MQGSFFSRVWVRFGLCIAATVLATMALLTVSVMLFSEVQYRDFYRSLPTNVQRELDDLRERDMEDSPRARWRSTGATGTATCCSARNGRWWSVSWSACPSG